MKFASEKRACSAFRSFSQSVFRETHTYATPATHTDGHVPRADARPQTRQLGCRPVTSHAPSSPQIKCDEYKHAKHCPAAAGKGHAAVGCEASDATVRIGCAADSAGVWCWLAAALAQPEWGAGRLKVVLAVSTGRSLDDGGSQRSSRGRRSRVRAANATCAACLRALPARLCRRGKVRWWQAVQCSAAAACGQRCLEAARSRRMLHCTLEPAWLLRLRVGLGC